MDVSGDPNYSQAQLEVMSPREYRMLRRQRKLTGFTIGNCKGYILSNVTIVPKSAAFEYFLWCQRNPKPCMLLDVTDPGDPEPRYAAPGADLRTDLGKYYVYKKGELVDTPTDIGKYWNDDLVSFIYGSSPSWHYILDEAKLKFRFVGGYVTNLQTIPAGPFRGQIIASCRVFEDSVSAIRAVQITSRYPLCHGTPVYMGDPKVIGVDISKPVVCQTGDPHSRPVLPGEIPVFWPAGPTNQSAAVAAKLDLMITHVPGWNLACDTGLEETAAI